MSVKDPHETGATTDRDELTDSFSADATHNNSNQNWKAKQVISIRKSKKLNSRLPKYKSSLN